MTVHQPTIKQTVSVWLVRIFTLLFIVSSLPNIVQAEQAKTKNTKPKQNASKSLRLNTIWGFYPNYPKVNYGKGKEAELVKQGEYLVRVGDCISCHTDTRRSVKNHQPFAGGLPLETPFGTYFGPNLTPDKATGLGNWTEKDFINAMHNGKRKNGANLFPVFPFLYFTKINKNDLRAIWAYLRKLPPVKKANKPTTAPFPFSWRFSLLGWRIMYFYPNKGEFKYDPSHSKQWNRGAYLVEGLGHCGMCHTPINILGAPKNKYYLTGAFVQHYWAPNITNYGLARATPSDIVNVFKEDELLHRAGDVIGPMKEVDHNSLMYLKDSDLFAIAVYLKTVKSKEPLFIKPSDLAPTVERGRKVFQTACKTCHIQGEVGAPRIGDAENWGQRVKKGVPILYHNAINGYNQMPYKGACVTCSDNDIESAVDYILYKSLTRQQYKEMKHPKARIQPTKADGKRIYKQVCGQCHNVGLLGAPKLGDKKAWKPVLAKNMDVIITNTITGIGKMPRNGGCKHCSTAEIIAAVKYMVKESSDANYSLW